jgi:hypothetical protein
MVIMLLTRLKARSGWWHKCFSDPLRLLANILPNTNSSPTNTYLTEKDYYSTIINVYVKDQRYMMDMQKIHTCITLCILYHKEYVDLGRCLVFKACQHENNGKYDENEMILPSTQRSTICEEEDTSSNVEKKKRSPSIVV